MSSTIIIVSPPQHCDPSLAIAAVRAGEIGLLDLGTQQTQATRTAAIERLMRFAGDRPCWGLRWDLLGNQTPMPAALLDLNCGRVPYLLIAGHSGSAGTDALQPLLDQGRELAGKVLLEVYDPETAQAASALGFDGVVIKAREAGGQSSETPVFAWLQSLPGKLEQPFWIQAAWGPDTAAAAHLVGAAGIVLGEELWLARESSLSAAERVATGAPDANLGEGIVLAADLARRGLTVGGILERFRTGINANLVSVADQRPLAPGNRLATACGLQYPIFHQTDSTYIRVSSCAALAEQLQQGVRTIVLAGAWPELTYWQQAIDLLLESDVRGRDKIQLLFAADVQDACSSALIQVMIAGLAKAGYGVGLLIGPETAPSPALYEDLCVAGTERAATLSRHALPETAAPAIHIRPEPIAIVGMACRFARSPDLRSYWATIIDRLEVIEDVSPERWRPELYYSADRTERDKLYSIRGGFLEDAAFDPLKYGIPPASIRSIEPMQLLTLDVAFDALADAGYDKRPFARDDTAVIFGIDGVNDLGMGYSMRAMLPHYLDKLQGVDAATLDTLKAEFDEMLPEWTEDSFPGYLFNLLSGRVANKLDLRGANFTVDAACASSLAAVHVALDQLRQGSCRMALVGAADGSNHPFGFMSFAKTHALSPSGRACPFDENADGIVLGEGVAAIVLKPLSAAESDGDRIYSLISGIGSSSDGRSRSLTAPHAPTQAMALRRAYADAGIDPSTVSLIEAHATGTAVGDRSEIDALTQVFDGAGQRRNDCAIGSVKANVGHTKSVAGLAGMIKTSLALKHRVLPPTINVETPNKALDDGPFYVNTDSRPWLSPVEGTPRRGGVSAFGFGGTNFHLILEEYQGGFHDSDSLDLTPRPAEMFYWRAEGSHDLGRTLSELRDELRQTPGVNLAQLAFSIQLLSCDAADPSGSEMRLGLMASSVTDLIEKLDLALAYLQSGRDGAVPTGMYISSAPKVDPSEVCFLFPGQGSQRLDMLIDLVRDWPEGLAFAQQTDHLLAGLLPQPLSSYIYPAPSFDEDERERLRAQLNDTRYAQPALGLVDLLAFKMLKRYGLQPAFAAGHSYGEIVALCAGGVISETDLLRLSARRGQAVFEAARLNPGRMAAVSADAAETAAALTELRLSVQIANLNAPKQTIVAGSEGDVTEAIDKLRHRGFTVRRVPVTAAFHTPAMEAPLAQLSCLLRELDLRQTAFPVYSNVTAEAYPADVEAIRAQLASHLARPVRFVEQIQAMFRDGARLFIETGPGRILTGLVERILEGEDHHALAIEMPGRPGRLSLGDLLVRLSVLGLPVDRAPWFTNRLLAPQSPALSLAQARQQQQGRPTDWVIGPWGARPVTEPAIASSILSPPQAGNQVKEISALSKTTKKQTSNPLLEQLQGSMEKWLELQCMNQRLNERFLDIQERIVTALLNDGVPQQAAVKPAAAPAGLSVAPAPVLPALRPTVPVPADMTVAPAVPSPQSEPEVVPVEPTVTSPDGDDGLQGVEVFKRDLLAEVSRRTGYPEDILDLDLALEAGLGIDSIKTMEIFSALKRYHHVFADEDQDEEESLVQFTRLKTLRDIIDFYGARVGQITDVQAEVATVERLVLRPIAVPAQELNLTVELGSFPRDQIMLLLGEAPELAAATEAALTSSGLRVVRVVHGSQTRQAGPQKYEVDLADPLAVKRLAFWISENEDAPVGGLINLLTLSHEMRNRELNGHREPLQLVQWLMNVANVFEDQIRAASQTGGGRLINITTLDGRFGLRSNSALPIAQAGTLGFFKSLAHEWRGVRVKNIDLDPDADPQTLVVGLLREIAAWDELVEVGLDAEGRWSLELVPDATPADDAVELLATLPLDEQGVVLVTGGARGITAEVTKRMAAQTKARFIIVGRSTLTTVEDESADIRSITDEGALRAELIAARRRDNAEMIPAEIEYDLQRIQRDRAVRENLESMQASGATVEYHSLNVRDDDAFAVLIDDIYERFGRIDGVLHGAGVIEDGWLRNKDAESFARVFETKVNSALLMAHRLRPENLRFMVFFSSISGRFGNLGQVDYAAANECLNKLADHLDHEWPGRVVSINWGPWDAGMISDGLRQAYQERGIKLIPIEQGVEALLGELCRESSQVPEVVLTCSPHEFAPIV